MDKTSRPRDPVALPPVEPLSFREDARGKFESVWIELAPLLREIRASKDFRKIVILSIFMAAILLAVMVSQVYLNQWIGSFYRALEHKNLNKILWTLAPFAGIIAVLLTLVVAQTLTHIRLQIRLRECLTRQILDKWLEPSRAYRLALSSDEAVNPDQRIQENVKNFAEMSADLVIGFVQASSLLVSFIGVLWIQSRKVSFAYHGEMYQIPGYMVWIALAYAIFGSILAAWVGRPLIKLNEERYSREGIFRFSIVRVNESAEGISLYSGEKDEHRWLSRDFDAVLDVMFRFSTALARLTWVTSGYGWVMIVLPVLAALPGFLQGTIDFGGLMVVVGAFNQVQASLRWYVDNYARIADWRAAMHRVSVFHHAMVSMDDFERQSGQIRIEPHPEGLLSFRETQVHLVDGKVLIADASAEIKKGERILLTGASGSGKSTLFRAVGGLWPWGSGSIKIPPTQDMMFLPQKPYMPLGTLAHALSYPKTSNSYTKEQMQEALRATNLEEFCVDLPRQERWDRLMSQGQLQRLAFARLLLHKPKWIFLDEATSALDEENEKTVMDLFRADLSDSTLVSIGHRSTLSAYHDRTLHLVDSPGGTILARRPEKPGARRRRFLESLGSALKSSEGRGKRRR